MVCLCLRAMNLPLALRVVAQYSNKVHSESFLPPIVVSIDGPLPLAHKTSLNAGTNTFLMFF